MVVVLRINKYHFNQNSVLMEDIAEITGISSDSIIIFPVVCMATCADVNENALDKDKW